MIQIKQIKNETSKAKENNRSVHYSEACRKQTDANQYKKDSKEYKRSL